MLYLTFDKNSDFYTYSRLIKSAIKDKASKGEPTTGNFLLDYALEQFRTIEKAVDTLKGGVEK
jgi:hypothetical protein